MIEVVELTQTCDVCPSQWEGKTADGRTIYVRFRWGYLSIGLGGTIDEAIGDETFGREISDGMDGYLPYEELRRVTAGHFIWPDSVGSAD